MSKPRTLTAAGTTRGFYGDHDLAGDVVILRGALTGGPVSSRAGLLLRARVPVAGGSGS